MNQLNNQTSYETNIIGMFNLLDFAFICTRRSGFSLKESPSQANLQVERSRQPLIASFVFQDTFGSLRFSKVLLSKVC